MDEKNVAVATENSAKQLYVKPQTEVIELEPADVVKTEDYGWRCISGYYNYWDAQLQKWVPDKKWGTCV